MIVNNLIKEFIQSRFLKTVKEAFIAVALVNDKALRFYLDRVNPDATQQFLIGLDLLTAPSVLETIISENPERITGKAFLDEFFHPKVYLFKKQNDEWISYCGSGNFTMGGIQNNIELFYRVTDQQVCLDIRAWFQLHYQNSTPINQRFIDQYKLTYSKIDKLRSPDVPELTAFKSRMKKFDISSIDFTDQFFSLSNHEVLSDENATKPNHNIHIERENLRKRLYELNELLAPNLDKIGDLHEHYDKQHIVASTNLLNHHDHQIKALWMAYGRNKEDIKSYTEGIDFKNYKMIFKTSDGIAEKEYNTPVNFIRMQIIVRYDNIGIWLMPGKKGGSPYDRDFFQKQIKNSESYKKQFFSLVQQLPSGYFIDVGGVVSPIHSFKTAEELSARALTDDWQKYYFAIGRNYSVGCREFTNKNIISTVVEGFTILYPLYQLMKAPQY